MKTIRVERKYIILNFIDSEFEFIKKYKPELTRLIKPLKGNYYRVEELDFEYILEKLEFVPLELQGDNIKKLDKNFKALYKNIIQQAENGDYLEIFYITTLLYENAEINILNDLELELKKYVKLIRYSKNLKSATLSFRIKNKYKANINYDFANKKVVLNVDARIDGKFLEKALKNPISENLYLSDFEYNIDEVITDRGMLYYKEKNVQILLEMEKDEYHAIVSGQENYTVGIKLEGDKVISSECNCPYTGEYCKHEVAVLFALKNNERMIRDGEILMPELLTKANHLLRSGAKPKEEIINQLSLALYCTKDDEKITALLQNINISYEYLKNEFPKYIVDAIELLNVNFLDNSSIIKIRENELAKKVKINELKYNIRLAGYYNDSKKMNEEIEKNKQLIDNLEHSLIFIAD